MRGVTSEWFVVCVGDEMKDKFMVVHEKTNV
jgi:hypothetical protein